MNEFANSINQMKSCYFIFFLTLEFAEAMSCSCIMLLIVHIWTAFEYSNFVVESDDMLLSKAMKVKAEAWLK